LIPEINSKEASVASTVLKVSESVRVEKEGAVLGLESELDPRARTAQLLIGIDDPLDNSEIPLLIGSFVDVEIQGKSIDKSIRLPATSLREGSYVLIADSDLKLAKRVVEIGWFDNDDVVVVGGLNAGDRVVTTPISYPIFGTSLTILND
jgi:multidrug efflux pump subunit AcrA (membrane-fusion protein)